MPLVVVGIGAPVDEVLEREHLALVQVGVRRVDAGVDDRRDQVATGVRDWVPVGVAVEARCVDAGLRDPKGQLRAVVERADDRVLLDPPDPRNSRERPRIVGRHGGREAVDDADPLADGEATDPPREVRNARPRRIPLQRDDDVDLLRGRSRRNSCLEIVENLVAVEVDLRLRLLGGGRDLPPLGGGTGRGKGEERDRDDRSDQAPADRRRTIHSY